MDMARYFTNKNTSEIGLTPATKRLWENYQNGKLRDIYSPPSQPIHVKPPQPKAPTSIRFTSQGHDTRQPWELKTSSVVCFLTALKNASEAIHEQA